MVCRFLKDSRCTLTIRLISDFLIDFISYLRDNVPLINLFGKEYIIDEKCTCRLESFLISDAILTFRCIDDNQEFILTIKLAGLREYYKIERGQKDSVLQYLADLYHSYICSAIKEKKCYKEEQTLHA